MYLCQARNWLPHSLAASRRAPLALQSRRPRAVAFWLVQDFEVIAQAFGVGFEDLVPTLPSDKVNKIALQFLFP